MEINIDYSIGSRLFHAGKAIEECATADQRAGWRAEVGQ